MGKISQAALKVGALAERAAFLVGVDGFAARLFQSAVLQIRVLLFGGDATIADFHAPILTVNSDACNPLFLQG